MIRRTAALILALTLNSALLHAEDMVLTINVPSANVHKGPSNVTPVIGHVARGTALPISRNLGSWVKVAWPGASDGVGYVHVTMGRIGSPNAGAPAASALPQTVSAPGPTRTTATIPPSARPSTSVGEYVVPRGSIDITPASHTVGVGGLVGPLSTVGATARAWPHKHLGIQFGFTRDAMRSDAAAGRVTSTQLEPGVVYALFDRVSDDVWIRPYVGSAVSVRHQTLSGAALDSTSDTNLGFRVFGGSELMFASLPRFGLSADLGYRRFPTPFPGFEPARLSVSIAGHWYIK
jgi:hypothetical protein